MEHEMALALIEPSQPSNDSPVLPNVKNSRGKKRDVKQDVPKKPKASWDDFCVHTFISICVEEAVNGNKPSSTLNKVGYENLEKKFKERTGYAYNRVQLKNQWNSLKNDRQNWKVLGQQTGLGWCTDRNTYKQTDEWWANFAKVHI